MDAILDTDDVIHNTVDSDVNGVLQCVIPFFIHDDDEEDYLGLVLLTDERVSFKYYNKQIWESIGEYEYEHPVTVMDKDTLEPDVFFYQNDANVTRYLSRRVADALSQTWGIVFDRYQTTSSLSEVKNIQDMCSCTSISSDRIKETYVIASESNHYIIRCDKCLQPIGINKNGVNVPKERVYDCDWLRVDDDTDVSSISLQHDLNMLYTTEELPVNFQYTTELMGEECIFDIDMNEPFKPSEHNVALLEYNTKLIGYIIWMDNTDETIVKELFIRDRYRRRGFGAQFLEGWAEHILPGTEYYILNINNQMKQLLSKINHAMGSGGYVAHPCFKLSGIGKAYDSLDVIEK